MSEERGLFQAILDNPADDTVRLAYADWLDEHDRSDRAEFIRVQIELAALSPCGHIWDFEEDSKCRYCQLIQIERRYIDLSPQNKDKPLWQPDYWLQVKGHSELAFYATWRRGFVDCVSCTLKDFYGQVGVGCKSCGGDGLATGPPEYRPCRSCSGRGRIGVQRGAALDLFRRYPISEIRLNDRRPNFYNNHYDWLVMPEIDREDQAISTNKAIINRDIYYLCGGRGWAFFSNYLDAYKALSNACVRYGRKFAKLPPLAEPL